MNTPNTSEDKMNPISRRRNLCRLTDSGKISFNKALHNNKFTGIEQFAKKLAEKNSEERVGRSTTKDFANGKPISCTYAKKICDPLGLEWHKITITTGVDEDETNHEDTPPIDYCFPLDRDLYIIITKIFLPNYVRASLGLILKLLIQFFLQKRFGDSITVDFKIGKDEIRISIKGDLKHIEKLRSKIHSEIQKASNMFRIVGQVTSAIWNSAKWIVSQVATVTQLIASQVAKMIRNLPRWSVSEDIRKNFVIAIVVCALAVNTHQHWDSIALSLNEAWDSIALSLNEAWDSIVPAIKQMALAIKDIPSVLPSFLHSIAHSTWQLVSVYAGKMLLMLIVGGGIAYTLQRARE